MRINDGYYDGFDFNRMCKMLKEHTPFTFSRWGDGEWNAILGVKGANCDGHEYFQDMGERLRGVLKQPQRYFMGMQGFATKRMGPAIEKWQVENVIQHKWCDADILHNASRERWMISRFARELWGRKVILVGPIHLLPMAKWNDWDTMFVPSKNVWLVNDQAHKVFEDMQNRIKDEQDPVFLWSCGMPAKIWIDEWFAKCGATSTHIDTGSMLDYYAGVNSRNYHKQMEAAGNAK